MGTHAKEQTGAALSSLRDGAARRAGVARDAAVCRVQAMTPEELESIGAEIILGNTFHLMLRPGTEVIQAHGDLHDFMHWEKPILTDSGGFQVFSLGEMRKITEEGVHFRSPVNGSKVFLGPEEAIAVQHLLGSDIVMVFDECTPYPADEQTARISMELSMRWSIRCKEAHGDSKNALFGIVQGGMHPALRSESLAHLIETGFDGYAIGGLSVGEPKEEMIKILDLTAGVKEVNELKMVLTQALDNVSRGKTKKHRYRI